MSKLKKVLGMIAVSVCISSGIGLFSPLVSYAASKDNSVPEGYTAIYTAEDLYGINNDLDGNYILMNDIDLSETKPGGSLDTGHGWTPIGTSWLDSFNGTFDGNGFHIKNMCIYVDENTQSNYIGLFGYCSSGSDISHLAIENAHIEINATTELSSDDKGLSCGIIVGYISGGRINECYTTGRISCSSDNGNIGGIAGNLSSELTNCYSTAEIEVKGSGNVIGGISGGKERDNWKKNNYSRTTLDADNRNTVNAVGTAGYYLSTIGKDEDALPLSETQMRSAQYFSGFDFEKTWFIDPYSSYIYPQLKNVPATKLEKISIISEPTKKTYYSTEQVDPTGARISLLYTDGKESTADISDDMIYYNMKVGTTTVTVSYLGKETSFDITVKDAYSICYFDENGGEPIDTPYKDLVIGKTYGSLPKAARNGYLFDGWFTKKQGGEKITSDTIVTSSEEHVIYAHWTKASVKKVTNLKVSAGSNKIGVRWSKVKNAVGYEVFYYYIDNASANIDFSVYTDRAAKTIKRLSPDTKYYVSVRAYIVDSADNIIYGKWSKIKSVKTSR